MSESIDRQQSVARRRVARCRVARCRVAQRRDRDRRAMALVLVLIVVALLTLGALTFSQIMLAERRAAGLGTRKIQARLAAESGIAGIQMFLMQDEEVQFEMGGVYDNPDQMVGMLSDGMDGLDAVQFMIVSPRLSDDGRSWVGIRYGVEDESSRLNINMLAQTGATDEEAEAEGESGGSADMFELDGLSELDPEEEPDTTDHDILLLLPGMTDEMADSILDWLDDDDEPREFGAEYDYYSNLTPPYTPRNGPLMTVDELLLVRGVTPTLLYGTDTNRNGMIDASEGDPSMMGVVDSTSGSMNRGWSGLLTVHSQGAAESDEESTVINLNDKDLEALQEAIEGSFSEEMATFVVAMRQNGPYDGESEGNAGQSVEIDASKDAIYEFGSVFDILNARVEVQSEDSGGGRPSGGGQQSTVLASPLTLESEDFATTLDLLIETCSTSETPFGRVNVNRAPRGVLLCLPGMTDELADRIIAERIEDPMMAAMPEESDGVAWLLVNEVLTIEEMSSFGEYVRGSSEIVRFQTIGVFDTGTPSSRLEVIMDTSQQPAKVLEVRDLSQFGRGYSIEMLETGVF